MVSLRVDLQVHSRLGKKHAHPRKMQGESRMITLAAEMPVPAVQAAGISHT